MDPLGNVVREFLKVKHAANVRNAVALATELLDERMDAGQIEEMLYSSGFDKVVVTEALAQIPKSK